MKIAGRKNDGAWFRTNKWLKGLPDPVTQDIQADPEIRAIGDVAIGVMANLAGLDSAAFAAVQTARGLPSTGQALAAGWVDNGIPRQFYLGKLSWDRYLKVMPGANIPGTDRTNTANIPIYVPQNAQAMADVGFRLRKKMNDFRLTYRQLQDLSNLESDITLNPGGLPNATKPVLGHG